MESYIDEESLIAAGGELVDSGIRIGNWKIQSSHGVMLKDSELDTLRQQLDGVRKMPEIVFGNNTLELVHEPSSQRIKFCAFDALQQWTKDQLPPLKVKIADNWQKDRQQDIANCHPQMLYYDWTFTSSYSGSYDPGLEWLESQNGIDFELLKRKDPILFYDSIPLYESELDDTGSCKFEVMIRVMKQFWFLIGRYFLRVDDHLIRLKETRLFSKFSTNEPIVVIRNQKHWECTIEELEQQRLSTSVEIPGFGDISSTASSLHSLFPDGTHLDLQQEASIT